MKTEAGLTRNQILSELTRSPHGKLEEYLPVGRKAAETEPEFFAHLLCYNRLRGQIRDSQVALPVISLAVGSFPEDLIENSLAHISLLGPRELERAYRFALTIKLPGRMRMLLRVIRGYLSELESNPRKWDAVAITHRKTLANLYAMSHARRSERIGGILFGQNDGKPATQHPEGSIFGIVAKLGSMSALEAAGAILEHRIPFMVAMGALGKKREDPDLVLALMKQMTPTQFVTNIKMLEKLGVKTNPALRGAFDEAMERASKSTRNVLKTTRAAENIDDEEMKEKLGGLQERQINKMAGVEGDWLVLADKSGSMSQAIEAGRLVAATLAKMVKGKVHLVFFDNSPTRIIDATGKTYEEIKAETKMITANGGTSIGCGLMWAMDKKLEVNGIAIVSDGGENASPRFPDMYRQYSQTHGTQVPVYLYQCAGENPVLIGDMQHAGHDLQVFDIRTGVDFYSLPNLVQTMRTQRYGLVEEIMEYKLLTLSDAFKKQAELVAA